MNHKGVCRIAMATPGLLNQSVSDHLKVSREAKKNVKHQFTLINHNIFMKKIGSLFKESAIRPILSSSRDDRLFFSRPLIGPQVT